MKEARRGGADQQGGHTRGCRALRAWWRGWSWTGGREGIFFCRVDC